MSIRDCTHPIAQHQHGTATAYKRDKCRCSPCTRAQNVEDRCRRLDAHLGVPRRIDAGPVRDHIRALKAAGIGNQRLAQLAGVSASTVSKLVHRDPNRRDGLPQQNITPATAAKILAVQASLENASKGALLDGTGTLRRLHALHARGWSRRALAAELGVATYSLGYIEQRGTATGSMARAVRDLYDRLWDQQPPNGTQQEQAAITTTLRWAAQNRWQPPAAWDDETIDDPTSRPRGTVRARLTATQRLDELMFLVRSGAPLDDAVRRTGYAEWGNARQAAVKHNHPAAALMQNELERAA